MLPKKRITAAFTVIALAAIAIAAAAAVGTDSHTGSHHTSHAVYLNSGGNNFQNVFSTNLTGIYFGSTIDKDKAHFHFFTASSANGSATASIRSSKNKSQNAAPHTAPHTAFFYLTAVQRNKIERVVMTSCGELDDSLMAKANAQVILDRVKSGRFGKGINAVLDAPHQFETPWKGSVNKLVKNAVSAVFDHGERVTKMRIYYYENPNLKEVSTEVWRHDKRYVKTIGHGIYIHEYWTDKK